LSIGKAYIAFRWHGEIFANGQKDTSTAVTMKVAAWAIDYTDILEARLRGCEYLGVMERAKGGDVFLIELEKCRDPAYWIKKLDYTKQGIPDTQRAIGYHWFARRAGSAVL
jgi:hypothetical protein